MQEHYTDLEPLPSPEAAQETAIEVPKEGGKEKIPTAPFVETDGPTEPVQDVPESTVETNDPMRPEERVQEAPEVDLEKIQEAPDPEIDSDQEPLPGDDEVSSQIDQEPLSGHDEDDSQESAPSSEVPASNRSTREYETKMNKHPMFRCLSCLGCGCCARAPKRWPRTFWVLFGVVMPLWILILIASVCGYGLAQLEAPTEISTNDEKLTAKYQIAAVDNMTKRVIAASPSLCLHLYGLNETMPELGSYDDIETVGFYEAAVLFEANLLEFLDVASVFDIEYNDTITVNTTKLVSFMTNCGKLIEEYVTQIQLASAVFFADQGDLTFNWDRCVNKSDTDGWITIDLPWSGEATYEALHPVSISV
jgi:hypothetical protein